jgi:hypothetical protein
VTKLGNENVHVLPNLQPHIKILYLLSTHPQPWEQPPSLSRDSTPWGNNSYSVFPQVYTLFPVHLDSGSLIEKYGFEKSIFHLSVVKKGCFAFHSKKFKDNVLNISLKMGILL